MVKVDIWKKHGNGGEGKSFPIENGEIEILHEKTDEKDIVRVTINGRVEFEYDVYKPDKEVVGYFTSKEEWDEITKHMTEVQKRRIII